ncbi:DUF2894 domain-containing protein [Ramlibacter sp. AW1]|uniref:DUF2894 domain-containing protein n=1 Tax=Ramlibacter aurantiacus TaxID=2801330 RepID=A0A937D8C2_9BURK|nr:DUF2894 domain-containing protein [Ramlibacter aurantiacus]MBL0422903.1 DUF2894 domain-containing protein [Ramlibacter aurantiacus]
MSRTAAERLEPLRASGGWRVDPVRWRYLEALARRIDEQPSPAVRGLLDQRLQDALQDFTHRVGAARQQADDTAARLSAHGTLLAREARRLRAAGDTRALLRLLQDAQASSRAGAPLQELNQYIRQVRATDEADPRSPSQRPELASVQRFRQDWTRSRAQAQVERAASRRPANAGPLNSHALVLQSLALMRELSPEYLRHFLLHVESLQWLEDARQRHVPPAGGKPAARKGRSGRKR